MDYSYLHCMNRDFQCCKVNTKKEDVNKRVKVIKKVSGDFNINDSKTQNYRFVKDNTFKIVSDSTNIQRNVCSSGSVEKQPLKRSKVTSAPSFDYSNAGGYECALVPISYIPNSKRTTLKTAFHNKDTDIDYIPVKLVSSDSNIFSYKMMKGAKQKQNSTKVVHSTWGRILKEQTGKEPKKNVPQTLSQRTPTNITAIKTQPHVIKDKRVLHDTRKVIQVVQSQGDRIIKQPIPVSAGSYHSSLADRVDNYGYAKKISIQPMKPDLEHSELPTTDSDTTITGESIMYVDRSVQCTPSNADIDCKWPRNIDDINRGGDDGVAYLNPVRTLNFLIRELRGKFSESSQDDNMARIIRDMEQTISRLTNSPQHMTEKNWNTLISEEDLKCVLDLLQTPVNRKNIEVENKEKLELQCKLEDACSKLETMCKQMEKVTTAKLKDEKQILQSELKEKNTEIDSLNLKLSKQERRVQELEAKADEQNKIIASLKDTYNKSSALNKILIEQLDDTEKKYQQLVTEMQFLLLEKEKNLLLMKCKEQDLSEMRKNLEEVKSLVIQHLSAITESESSANLIKWNKLDLDNLTGISALSMTVVPPNKTKQNELPKCSSPVEQNSPSPDDDESWRKISNVPVITSLSQEQVPERHNNKNNIYIKESLRSIINEMKQQAQLNKNMTMRNSLGSDDVMNITNWSDLDISDDDLQSDVRLSDTETNF